MSLSESSVKETRERESSIKRLMVRPWRIWNLYVSNSNIIQDTWILKMILVFLKLQVFSSEDHKLASENYYKKKVKSVFLRIKNIFRINYQSTDGLDLINFTRAVISNVLK